MTGTYKTPEVLHITECDGDGNRMLVRYYREDVINNFVMKTEKRLKEIKEMADMPDQKRKTKITAANAAEGTMIGSD